MLWIGVLAALGAAVFAAIAWDAGVFRRRVPDTLSGTWV